MAKFATAWGALALFTLASVWGAWFAMGWSSDMAQQVSASATENQALKVSNERLRQNLIGSREAAERVSKFLQAWEPYTNPLADKKDRQMAIIRVLEEEAVNLQDLLVGQKVTPTNKTYRFGDQTIDVEHVEMQVSGPVTKTLVFFGRVEEVFPYARVKRWKLEPTEGGQAVALNFALVQPVKKAKP